MRYLKTYKIFENNVEEDLIQDLIRNMSEIIIDNCTLPVLYRTNYMKWDAVMNGKEENWDFNWFPDPNEKKVVMDIASKRNAYDKDYDRFVRCFDHGDFERYKGWSYSTFMMTFSVSSHLAFLCFWVSRTDWDNDKLISIIGDFFDIGWEEVEL